MIRSSAMHRLLMGSSSFLPAAIALALVGGSASVTFAQPAAAPPPAASAPQDALPAPPPAPTPAPTEIPAEPPAPAPAVDADAQWKAVYARGKAALSAGSFPPAVTMLNDVATRASDPTLRAQARELGQLASYWAYNQFRLTPPMNTLPPPGGKPAGVLEDKRTLDELGVLYTNSVLWGTGLGVVVGIVGEFDSAAGFFLPAIGMAAVGAGAVALMDVKYGPLPYGVPQSITSGMYIGLEAGIYLTGIMVAENVVRGDSEKVYSGLIWGTATAGALLGGLIGATTPVTPGRASFTSTGALWGGLTTSLLTIGITDGESFTAPFVTGLIGATAGGLTTGFLAKSFSPSIARVRFIDLGGFAGGLVLGGLYASLTDRFDGQAVAFLTSTGVIGGLALSAYLTKDMERDEPRRAYVRKASDWRMTPFMTPQPGGGTLGLAGTF